MEQKKNNWPPFPTKADDLKTWAAKAEKLVDPEELKRLNNYAKETAIEMSKK